MKATYNATAKTSFTTKHRNEGKSYFSSYSIISLADKPHDSGSIGVKIELRIYGTGTANTACLWVTVPEKWERDKETAKRVHTYGSGKAGGGGYHRASAAAHYAITNAGFTLSEPIDGRGEGPIREALMAMAKCLKIKRPALVESYQ